MKGKGGRSKGRIVRESDEMASCEKMKRKREAVLEGCVSWLWFSSSSKNG